MSMRTGTFRCWLWGHKFHGEKVEFDPHYLAGVKDGFVNTRTYGDYHMVGFKTDYCTRCGINRL